MKYRAKPTIVEAFRFDTDAEVTAPLWFGAMVQEEAVYIDRVIEDGGTRVYGCTISTPQGRIRAKVGDFIIREDTGSVRILKPSQFKQQYEKVRT